MLDINKIIKELTPERKKSVVDKFKEYGFGLILSEYVHGKVITPRFTLWHQLVYPDQTTGRLPFDFKFLKARFNSFSKKVKLDSSEVVELLEGTESVVYEKVDSFGKIIGITYEEILIFFWAVLEKVKDVEAYNKAKAEYERSKREIGEYKLKNKPEELIKEKEDFVKKFEEKFDIKANKADDIFSLLD